jgi:hypothetical protein
LAAEQTSTGEAAAAATAKVVLVVEAGNELVGAEMVVDDPPVVGTALDGTLVDELAEAAAAKATV